MDFELTVNGERRRVDVDPQTPLLWVLREQLGLAGTKYGCGVAQCGACTVHVGRRPVRSCVVPVASVAGREVTTIEGLAGPVAEAVQASWVELQVPQCGYCQSGQIMSAVALLEAVPRPSDEDVDRSLAGNICRCATYHRIRQAVHAAAGRAAGAKP
jgi:isoquinoline 1-oxidoreductase alpha subunit